MNNNIIRTRSLSLKILLTIFFAGACIVLLRPLSVSRGNEKEQPTQSESSPKTPAAAAELARRIDALIHKDEPGAARWGICVFSMADGSTIYEQNANKLFTPASNMKMYTTGVALDLLGADYRWRTSVYADTQPDANGRVNGDLILYGRGAPDFVAISNDKNRASIAKLADELFARGVRSVVGNVIGDESYFRGNQLGDGWQWTDLQWYFAAEASALTVNGNEVDINFVPGSKLGESKVRTTDTEAYVTVENRMAPIGDRGAQPTVGVHRGLSDNNIEVWGEYVAASKGFGARLSVHKPALWAAKLFVRALKTRGIQVYGETLSRDSRVPQSQRFDSSQSHELAFVNSQPLSEIARQTNKESNNLFAELILRTLGRERGDMAGRPPGAQVERGDDEAGLAVIRLWLTRAAISNGHLALHDGSGLSRLNLVTPESSARLLLSLSKANAAQVFRDSLPTAGRDGTLGGRLKELQDSVWAKTGSLTYDNALSGYLRTAKGEFLAFSIMCNDQTERRDNVRLIDEIVNLVAAYPDFPAHGS
jgi:D-alanyl-D-alanine carboxypeptidase/D-alanyl-D-alanine-endopeptidase (penicillin-binding protein 4)